MVFHPQFIVNVLFCDPVQFVIKYDHFHITCADYIFFFLPIALSTKLRLSDEEAFV